MITGGLRVGMGSIALKEVRGVETPEAYGPDFTSMTVPRASQSNVKGDDVELVAGARGE
jgi:hypothetical protein